MSTSNQNTGGLNPLNIVATGVLSPSRNTEGMETQPSQDEVTASLSVNSLEKTPLLNKAQNQNVTEKTEDEIPTEEEYQVVSNSKKRKPLRSPEKEPPIEQQITTYEKMKQWIQDAVDTASSLKIHTTQTVNTKQEIKSGVNKIYSILKQLERSCLKFETEQKVKNITIAETQNQTVTTEITEEIGHLAGDPSTRTEERIASLVEREWPANVFSRVSLCAGAPDPTTNASVVLVINEQENPQLIDVMLRKIPDLKIILEEGIETKEFKYIENITRSSTGTTISKKTFLAKVEDEKGLIKLVDDIRQQDQSKSYKFAVTDSLDWTCSRKALEIAASFADLQIELHIPRGKIPKNEKTDNSQPTKSYSKAAKSRWKPKAIHVKIKDGNRPIADIVKEMKEKIDVDKMGVRVKSIKTNEENGSFKIIANGKNDSKAMTELANEIQNNLDGVVAKSETAFENSVIIRNIDTVTSIHQVAIVVAQRLGKEVPELESKINLKPTHRRDAQVAMLRLNDEDLGKLGKSFRLGWTDCVVEKMVIPKRCNNCRGYGHIARECKAEAFATKGLCRKCNESGHDSTSCTKDPQCRDCKTSGHMSGTMACPKYRNLVREAKQTPSKKKGRKNPRDKLMRLALTDTASVSSDASQSRRMSLDNVQISSDPTI